MEHTAKNFTLQIGSLISLFISLPALIALLFSIINIQYPDAASGYWEFDSATSTIRSTIAFLIVFFPTYIILTRTVNTIRRSTSESYIQITKWLIYIALLIGGGVLLGDLVAVINGFLNGELTTRFILKALVVLGVVGTAFVYYLFDVRQYWQTHERQSLYYALGITVVVLAALIFGYNSIETPSTVREMRIDAEQINDLSLIQSYIINYYTVHNSLPSTLTEIAAEYELPESREGRLPYTYTVTDNGYNLCATFTYSTPKNDQYATMPQYIDPEMPIKNIDNWYHKDGHWCFERTVIKKESIIQK
jgi:hypothetical protein